MRVYEKVRTYMANNDLKQQMSQRKSISAKSFDAILNGKQTLYPKT